MPRAVRDAVLARDGLVCRHCGCQVSPGSRGRDALHFDHVEHWAAGGPNTVENLMVSCARCNLTRKKPTNAIRDRRGTAAVRRRGKWYWVDGYTPPHVIQPGTVWQEFFGDFPNSYPFEDVATSWRISPTKLIRLIETGFFEATVDGPIYVRRRELS